MADAPPVLNSQLPPEEFLRASQAFLEKEQAAADEASPTNAALTEAIIANADGVSDSLDSLLSAFDTEVLHAVKWADDMPQGHPLRKQPLYVRLWNASEWKSFWNILEAEKKENDVRKTLAPPLPTRESTSSFWFVVVTSLCTADGKSVFNEHVSEVEKRYDGPKGLIWANGVHTQSMMFNGLYTSENAVAKNSDTTNTSTSSGG